MTTTYTTTTTPDRWVIQTAEGTYLADPYETDLVTGAPVVSNVRKDAWEFATREEAEAEKAHLNGLGWYAKVLRRPGATSTVLTDEGRAQVAARRAARKHERG